MNQMKFPKTLAAAKKAKGAEWSLADALLAEVGPRGSDARFRECAEYLKDHGIEYTAVYLHALHLAARNFPRSSREEWLTPNTAQKAGSPAVVQKAVEVKKEKAKAEDTPYTPPSQREIMSTKRVISHHARVASGGPKKTPTRKARASSAKSATPSELRRTADVLKLSILIGKAQQNARDFVKHLSGKTLTAEEREDLLSHIDDMAGAWAWARDAVKNPLSKEIEEFLAQQ